MSDVAIYHKGLDRTVMVPEAVVDAWCAGDGWSLASAKHLEPTAPEVAADGSTPESPTAKATTPKEKKS